MARIARSIRVTGRVQGVFFRAWTKQQADQLGVTGWVRNLPDGAVEALVQGEETAVAEMIARLHSGPPAATVERVQVRDAEGVSATAFSIRH